MVRSLSNPRRFGSELMLETVSVPAICVRLSRPRQSYMSPLLCSTGWHSAREATHKAANLDGECASDIAKRVQAHEIDQPLHALRRHMNKCSQATIASRPSR